MAIKFQQSDSQVILYDDKFFSESDSISFDPIVLEKLNLIKGTAIGRGKAYYLLISGVEMVLRQYRRGGMLSNILNNKYLWLGLAHTRPWQEWHLLTAMIKLGLPVPCPVACRIVKIKVIITFFYQADFLMTRILNAESLTIRLIKSELQDEIWKNIGQTIKRFHLFGINHADLNAHNILIDKNNKVYLIDFDKGRRMLPLDSWQKLNIARLKRSLLKLNQIETSFHYTSENWQSLLVGYLSINH